MIRYLAAGRLQALVSMPYAHHLAIHFPIAFALLAVGLAIVGRLRRSSEWERDAWRAELLAAVAAAVAVITGLLSSSHFVDAGGDSAKVALHRNVGLAALGALVLALIIARMTGGASRLAGLTSLVAAALVVAAAHLGGDLLHPGLAPWSREPHHHGPASMPATPSEAGRVVDVNVDGGAPSAASSDDASLEAIPSEHDAGIGSRQHHPNHTH